MWFARVATGFCLIQASLGGTPDKFQGEHSEFAPSRALDFLDFLEQNGVVPDQIRHLRNSKMLLNKTRKASPGDSINT